MKIVVAWSSQQHERLVERWRHIPQFVPGLGPRGGRETPARPFYFRPFEAARYGRFFGHLVASLAYRSESAFLW